ncbi:MULTISPECIES: ribonuclease YeeF family protein [Sporosarcina]|uniref:ribonuclease YeeF family protein n=2 Tax=Caryophanaceae TaxID=186818 RepID=UPI0018D285C8|nr:T7SS effector LXG polymorphic toxin [Sporosarcina psychrophila]
MKILDVDLFQEGLQRNITMLDRLSGEMEAIHHAVEGLVQMEEQFKGAGGNAIRSFYQECHLPFLHFFQLFSEQFKQVLQQMEAALHSLEPDSSGYIVEQFLEGELEQGLTLIGHLTDSLTDEANSIMDQVSDIVGLPHLDDSGVQEGVIRSKRKRDDTNSQLYEFDATQTTTLHPIEQDLQTMNTWLTDMEGLFQAGVKDISFVPSQWNVLTFRSEIRTELFPKVYLNPNDLWVKEHQQLIGTMITPATFQTLEGKKVNTVEENLDENIKYHMYENGLLIKEYVVGQTVYYEVVSQVDYKEEETVKVDKPKENKLLDSFQFGLDLAGLIPVVGEVADGVNGVIYTARGDALNAALSFGAMIPVAGWASTGGKLALKGNDLNQVRKVVSTEKVASIYSPIYQDVVNSPLGKTQNQLDILTNTHYQLGKPNALAFNMPFPKTDIPTSIKGGDVDVKVEVKNVDVGAKGTDKNITQGARYGERKISDETYAKLRRASPSSKIQKEVNKNIDDIIGTEDFALPGKIIEKKLHADHIVSLEKIARLEGFETLTYQQQKEIANFVENFKGLSEAANTSKGSKSFADWNIYKKENILVNPVFREKMILKEKELEIEIQKMTDEFNRINKKE